MLIKSVRRAVPAILAATVLAAAAQTAPAAPASKVPSVLKTWQLRSEVFICNIGRRPNFVVLRNHNPFTIPKGAKVFFVASNANKIVAQGYRVLKHAVPSNTRYVIRFKASLVRRNGRPTGCRAYARWYV